MPKYRVKLSDGRSVVVEADAPPSEEEVLSALGGDGDASPAGSSGYGSSVLPQLALGLAKEGARTVRGAGRLASGLVGGAASPTDPVAGYRRGGERFDELIPEVPETEGGVQETGAALGEMASFLPGSLAAAGATAGRRLLPRALAQGAAAAGTQAVREGEVDPKSMLAAGAGGVIGEGVGTGVGRLGQILQRSAANSIARLLGITDRPTVDRLAARMVEEGIIPGGMTPSLGRRGEEVLARTGARQGQATAAREAVEGSIPPESPVSFEQELADLTAPDAGPKGSATLVPRATKPARRAYEEAVSDLSDSLAFSGLAANRPAATVPGSGMVRLYRGESAVPAPKIPGRTTRTGSWYSDTPEDAELYMHAGGGKVGGGRGRGGRKLYIDVPESVARAAQVGPGEFVLPKSVTAGSKPFASPFDMSFAEAQEAKRGVQKRLQPMLERRLARGQGARGPKEEALQELSTRLRGRLETEFPELGAANKRESELLELQTLLKPLGDYSGGPGAASAAATAAAGAATQRPFATTVGLFRLLQRGPRWHTASAANKNFLARVIRTGRLPDLMRVLGPTALTEE